MKPLTLLLLGGLSITACNPPTAPQTTPDQYCRFISFDVPADCDGPPPPDSLPNSQAVLDSFSVSPTVVRAGDHFTAFAHARLSNCGNISQVVIDYANYVYNGNPPSISASLAAVAGDTVVTFYAECGFVFSPIQTLTIQVLPAQ